MKVRSMRNNVLVAGGGPAGLAAAIAARMRGFEVTLVDASVPPIDKACGEGLMPDGVAALRDLGIAPELHEHATFRGIRFVGPDGAAEAAFLAGCGIGLRRTVLHDVLRQRAEQIGVDTRWGVRVSGIAPRTVFVNNTPMDTRWIIGADGQNSRVRDCANLSRGAKKTIRIGLRRHFRVKLWTDFVEVHWGNTGQVYVTPVSSDEICVAVISRNPRADFGSIMEECPVLVERLAGATPIDDVRGSATATLKLRSVIAEDLALIGEASGSVDAITGEGMTLAFRQAVRLADAFEKDDLAAYAAAHRQIGRLPNLLGSVMLLMDRNENFRTRALRVLCDKPAIFQRLLAIHLGHISPFDLGVMGVAGIGWRLLKAT